MGSGFGFSLIGKKCRLEMTDGFNLYGFVDEIIDAGVFFRTDQESSFINFEKISSLKVQK